MWWAWVIGTAYALSTPVMLRIVIAARPGGGHHLAFDKRSKVRQWADWSWRVPTSVLMAPYAMVEIMWNEAS